jgi:hypothetical protein
VFDRRFDLGLVELADRVLHVVAHRVGRRRRADPSRRSVPIRWARLSCTVQPRSVGSFHWVSSSCAEARPSARPPRVCRWCRWGHHGCLTVLDSEWSTTGAR